MDLDREEISTIKTLLLLGFDQQFVTFVFSSLYRIVHHGLISQIARGSLYRCDIDYPYFRNGELEGVLHDISSRKLGLKNLDRFACYEYLYYMHSLRASDKLKSFSYSYHPVGQGLFCSGKILIENNNFFRWVFDCGTEKGRSSPKNQKLVTREINKLASEQSKPSSHQRPRLDLVVISHFDEDHLSGVVELLGKFSVETILLPYLSPWQRLLVALELGAKINRDLLSFLIDPHGFLSSVDGAEFERILYVPPSGASVADAPTNPLDDGVGGDGVVWSGVGYENKDEATFRNVESRLSGRVEIMKPGAVITIERAWEFVPYNDTSLAEKVTESFKRAARSGLKKLISAKTEDARTKALDSLIQTYDKQFKSQKSKRISGKSRNLISLFLYGGPIGEVQLEDVFETIPRHIMPTLHMCVTSQWLGTDRFGQFFTGDGFLETDQQWNDFKTFYSEHGRLKRGGFFQVMHHGSKHNWRNGLADEIRPLASIFCSNPAGTHQHPDDDVLVDFAEYNPQQVDATHGWTVTGYYRYD